MTMTTLGKAIYLLVGVAGFAAIAADTARAESEAYTTHTQTGVGQVQEQVWTVDHPQERPKGTQTYVGVTIDTATAGSWTISVTSNALVGCTLVTPITTSTSSFGGTARIELTLIDSDCHGVLHLTATSGAMTAAIRAGIDIGTPSPDTGAWQRDFWWLFWILGMVLTHTPLTPNPLFRLVADVVLEILVGFPSDNTQREVLMGAGLVVAAMDIVYAMMHPRRLLELEDRQSKTRRTPRRRLFRYRST